MVGHGDASFRFGHQIKAMIERVSWRRCYWHSDQIPLFYGIVNYRKCVCLVTAMDGGFGFRCQLNWSYRLVCAYHVLNDSKMHITHLHKYELIIHQLTKIRSVFFSSFVCLLVVSLLLFLQRIISRLAHKTMKIAFFSISRWCIRSLDLLFWHTFCSCFAIFE